jgi:site-specific DNA-methyltransferase (adenine-specific)
LNRVHFSSATVEWNTPQGVYEALNKEFHFTMDPCPAGGNEQGLPTLFKPWMGHRCFINPPYGKETNKWIEAWREAELAVYLLPARTDVAWFHDLVLPYAAEIRFIRGRLTFGDAKAPAPFPSMIVVFRGGKSKSNGRQLCAC